MDEERRRYLSEVLEEQGDLEGAIKVIGLYMAAGNPGNDGQERIADLKTKMEELHFVD